MDNLYSTLLLSSSRYVPSIHTDSQPHRSSFSILEDPVYLFSPLPLLPATLRIDKDQKWVGVINRVNLHFGKKTRIRKMGFFSKTVAEGWPAPRCFPPPQPQWGFWQIGAIPHFSHFIPSSEGSSQEKPTPFMYPQSLKGAQI